ncbi:chemotaxis protein CheX [[Clostridium] polysaccharolyticum]|jgi:hypothetical protein|uniref:Chemotaxis phosphatase CheX-like domain-containing protein n=1 Tax=[Clostridium] polysaccharolyticum TaxID=29364 RepID=A0A1I0FLA0_9FIRM|nr:hypothetical protein [[Clostridium] polysaccharolyticum]SET59136.1 hypothetical protein SAMN04487772_13320 [[Clostridium] polysaccharolyticum]
MFSHFFGNYLIRNNLITKQQFHEILLIQKTTRVKLGLMAVASRLLTVEQADQINQIQATKDKRFGDIAVEKGYLTNEQVDFLLSQQGSPFMAFTQASIESGFLTLQKINEMMTAFQNEFSITDDVLTAMKDGSTDAFTKHFLRINEPLFYEHFSLFLRNIIRFIQRDIYFDTVYSADSYAFDYLASQELQGNHRIFVGFSGNDEALFEIANPYADEIFSEVDEDVFDAICEFINCVNGLYARQLYDESIEEDMLPPVSYQNQTMIASGNFYVLPVYINDNKVDIIIAIDQNISFR